MTAEPSSSDEARHIFLCASSDTPPSDWVTHPLYARWLRQKLNFPSFTWAVAPLLLALAVPALALGQFVLPLSLLPLLRGGVFLLLGLALVVTVALPRLFPAPLNPAPLVVLLEVARRLQEQAPLPFSVHLLLTGSGTRGSKGMKSFLRSCSGYRYHDKENEPGKETKKDEQSSSKGGALFLSLSSFVEGEAGLFYGVTEGLLWEKPYNRYLVQNADWIAAASAVPVRSLRLRQRGDALVATQQKYPALTVLPVLAQQKPPSENKPLPHLPLSSTSSASSSPLTDSPPIEGTPETALPSPPSLMLSSLSISSSSQEEPSFADDLALLNRSAGFLVALVEHICQEEDTGETDLALPPIRRL